jgi:multidrug efflux pump subunit AcrB
VDRLTLWLSQRLAGWSLANVVRNRWVAAFWVGGAMGIFAMATIAFGTLPQTMYTERDGRNLGVTIELPAGTTLETSQTCADMVGDMLRQKTYLESVVKLVGQKSPLVQGSLGEALAPSEADYLLGFSGCVKYFVDVHDPILMLEKIAQAQFLN